MKARDRAVSAAWSLVVLIAAPVAHGATVSGTVNDLGATKPKDGIAGVWVVVKNSKGVPVGKGLTDANGVYRIEIPSGVDRPTAYFEKPGFQSRPTVQVISDIAKAQKPVYMVAESAGQDYYRTVANVMTAQAATLPPEERQQRATVIASLPAADKMRVTEDLKKLAATSVLADISIGEQNQRVISNVRSQLIADQALGNRPIWVVPDYRSPGTIQLHGSVQLAYDKARAEDIAKATPGVKGVHNQLMIAK